MAKLSRKTTRKEKRKYEKFRREFDETERLADAADNEYLRWLNKTTGRDHFRFPDGRLGSISARGGLRLELDDPKTKKALAKEMRKWARYDIKDDELVLSEEGRKEMEEEKEAEKNRKPVWRKAKDYAPTQTGVYKCMTEVGVLKKEVVEQEIRYFSTLMGGEWRQPKNTRVVYWLEE